MELGAVRATTAAHPKKQFGSNQHAECGGQEIHPKDLPLPASKCRTKDSRGIHAHSRERRFERDKNRIECADSEMNLTRDGQDLTQIKGEALGTLRVTVKIPGGEQLPGEYTLALRDGRQRLVASLLFANYDLKNYGKRARSTTSAAFRGQSGHP